MKKSTYMLIGFMVVWLLWPRQSVQAANPFSKLWQKVVSVVSGKKKPTCKPLTIVTKSLPNGTVGQPYSVQLQATGGVCGNKCCQ